MTVDAIKQEIGHLSEQERRELLDWLEEREDEAWDREMERDFSPGGRGMALVEKIKREIAEGNTIPLEEGLAQAKARRPQSPK